MVAYLCEVDILFAGIRVGGQQNHSNSCIVEIAKESDTNNSGVPSDDSVPLCIASGSTWLAVGNAAGGLELDDTQPRCVSATIEGVVPVELSEIVFGVHALQYEAALQVQEKITLLIKAQTALYYRGRQLMAVTEDKDKDPILLQCLMCQPVSQGVIFIGNNTRIAIVKSESVPYAPAGQSAGPITGSAFDNIGSTSRQFDSELEQWDLGAEWLILGNQPLKGTTKDTQMTAVELTMPIDHARLVPSMHPGEDVDNRGYMSISTLAKQGIVSGSWVSVSLSSADEKTKNGSIINSAAVLSCSSKHQRAIRIFGLDDTDLEDDVVALPPLLLYNIADRSFSSSASSKAPLAARSTVNVSITPLGSPPALPSPIFLKNAKTKHQPPLETARKITLSRVSSPLSERKDLETHSLAALQQWLSPDNQSKDKKGVYTAPLRVVKAGDLIAVRIQINDAILRTGVALMAGTDMANRIRSGDPDVDPSLVDIDPVTDLAIEACTDLNTSSKSSGEDGIVFYQVSHAEGFRNGRAAYGLESVMAFEDNYDETDICEGDNEDASDSSSTSESDDDEYELVEPSPDSVDSLDKSWARWYNQVRGKGFVVCPNVTVVMQTGAVRCRVPYRSVRSFINAKPSCGISTDFCQSQESAVTGQVARKEVSNGDVPYHSELEQLLRLANASLHPLAISRKLVCSALIKGNPGTGKRHLVNQTAERLGIHVYELSCYEILAESEDKTAQILEVYFQNACRYTPCVLHLRSIEALAQASNAAPGQENADDLPISRVLQRCVQELARAHKETGYPVVVIASSSQPDKVPASLAAAFRYEISLGVPDERTRLSLLKSITRSSVALAPDADMAYVAQQTASFVARDLATLVRRAESHAWRRARGKTPASPFGKSSTSIDCPLQTRDLALAGQMITNDDLMAALGDARASMSDTLGVPKIPNVKWDDVGGLADAKKDILDTIRLPMEQPHLFASGLSTRSGLLFYGPPGTGKTLLAKAIATECGLNFFSCKGPELISPYIGESEANVRRIFQKAREASPCVIFFDELDSLAPKRGQQGDSGGVMDRIVSQLLAELDGMSGGGSDKNAADDEDDPSSADVADSKQKKAKGASGSAVQVFAIGATNRPDLLDPALLRPGRFDKLVYLGVSETHEAQLNIIQALTRKFNLHPDLDLRVIAEKCPFHYTGADFYALCSDALLKAMLRTVDEVDALIKEWNEDSSREPNEEHPVPMTPQYYLDRIAPADVKQVTVTLQDFERALDELIPSVSADELVRYQALRRQFDSVLKGKDKQEIADSQAGSASEYAAAGKAAHSLTDSNPSVPSNRQKKKGKGKEPAH
ncbi:peroxisomal assembly protein [Coemansia sp. RSA 485]|nr:peroxisomal assembly protein [Coemansia sp. RSA 485]